MMDMENNSYAFSPITVNDHVFDVIMAEIKKFDSTSIPQPILLIGEEGSGKSTLLRRIQKSVSDRPLLRIEGRFIFKTADIIEAWENAGQPSLVIIDDWDYYLSRTDYDDQYSLRRVLYNEGAPMMIAAVRKIVPALVEYKAPFFEGLDFVYIQAIPDDSFTLFFNHSEIERAEKLLCLLPKTIASIIKIKEVFALSDRPQNDIDCLLSGFSDNYRNLYQSLPHYSQKILNCMGENLLLSEIRERTKLPTGILTPYLASLKKAGIIQIEKTIKRKNKYSIKDPLFRLWLRPSSQATD